MCWIPIYLSPFLPYYLFKLLKSKCHQIWKMPAKQQHNLFITIYWIYNYLCNQCLWPLKLWVRIPFMARCIQYNIMWSSLSVTSDRSVFFPGTLVSSTNKTDHHDITEIYNVESDTKHHNHNPYLFPIFKNYIPSWLQLWVLKLHFQ
jgi:hypothetical protein